MAKYVLRFTAEPVMTYQDDRTVDPARYHKSNKVPRVGRYLTYKNPRGHYSTADINEAWVFDSRRLPGGPCNPIDLPDCLEKVFVAVVAVNG